MAKKLLRGVLVDVENETVGIVEIKDELDEFYRILNCTCIDITVRRIGSNKQYRIVCDDEALCKGEPKISAVDYYGQVQLCGNLFIVGGEIDDGNLTSLTEDEAQRILRLVKKIPTRKHPDGYPILLHCTY